MAALIDSCTEEGNGPFPSFVSGKNLHHYKSNSKLFTFQHPQCNVELEKVKGNIVFSSTSKSDVGRLLILLMGLVKHSQQLPDFNKPFMYTQYGNNYGEQLETLGLTLRDKITNDQNWFVNADYSLDIVDYWYNRQNIVKFLTDLGFTPNVEKVNDFCNLVCDTNKVYFDRIMKCKTIANSVINNEHIDIDLSFFDATMTYVFLLKHFQKNHTDIKLLSGIPTNTKDFLDIFKD